MLLENINENVEVAAVFQTNKVWPVRLKWGNKVYKIQKVTEIHRVMDGDTFIHFFSVSDRLNFFKLAFNTKTLQWRLEQFYTEG